MNWWDRYYQYRERFISALDSRFYPIEYLDRLLAEGLAAIWFSDSACIVCELRSFPSGAKAVCGLIATGDKDEIVEQLIPQAEAWGKGQGCSFGMIESREGWGRVMKKYGYSPFQTAIVKEL